jgi:hypothetical protein
MVTVFELTDSDVLDPCFRVSVLFPLWFAVNNCVAVPVFTCRFNLPLLAAAGMVGICRFTSVPLRVPILVVVLEDSWMVPETGLRKLAAIFVHRLLMVEASFRVVTFVNVVGKAIVNP